MMSAINQGKIIHACRTLFGDDVEINPQLLSYIQSGGVKSAFRKKAKETHPDLFAEAPAHIRAQKTARLRDIIEAYEIMNRFFDQRAAGTGKNERAAPGRRARTSQTAQPEYQARSRYYRGVLPPRRLVLGKYLFYRGKITYRSLIDALLWQRSQRPTIAEIALQWGLLDRSASVRVSRLCGVPWLFGEKAVELGLLTQSQVHAMAAYQQTLEPRLGTYFVLKRFISGEEMEFLVREQREHNERLAASFGKPDVMMKYK